MYSDDVPVINDAMRRDVNAFKRGALFALLSIRQHVLNVPDQLDRVSRGDLEPLWGWKLKGYDYLTEHADALWHRARLALTPREAVNSLLSIPGLGIVKSAFVAQMMGHDVACLDSRNVKREGMNPRAYRTDGKAPYDLRHKVAHYCDSTQGRAQELWDIWCHEVAKANAMTSRAYIGTQSRLTTCRIHFNMFGIATIVLEVIITMIYETIVLACELILITWQLIYWTFRTLRLQWKIWRISNAHHSHR